MNQLSIKKLLSVFLLLIPLCVLSQTPDAEWKKGNDLYKNGQFKEAANTYEVLLKNGYESAPLYYNLGNCYYKLNETASSIYYYEKAKKLAPSDEDVNFNLSLANLSVVDKITPVPELFYQKWINNLAASFTSAQWSLFMTILIWLTVLAFSLFIISKSPLTKRIGFYLGVLFILKFFFCWYMASKQFQSEKSGNSAIIFSSSVYIKSSPNEKSTDLFILHEGTKVSISDELEGWKRIRLANGNEGWIKDSDIRTI